MEIALNTLFLLSAVLAGQATRPGHNPKILVPFPLGTVILLVLVGVPSLLQIAFPEVFRLFRGDPGSFAGGQWWRAVTAIGVQDGGLWGTVFNLILLLSIGFVAERHWGGFTLPLFFVAGIGLNTVGLVAGAWVAGNSGATMALGGALAVLILVRRKPGTVAAVVALLCGLVLIVLGNPHGSAVALGALVGLVFVWWAPGKPGTEPLP